VTTGSCDKKKYTLLSLISISLCLGLSVLGGYPGHHIKFLVVSIVYCLFTYLLLSWILNIREKYFSLLIVILPPLLIYCLLHITNFADTRIALPSTLAHFIGIGFGILIYISKLFIKAILGIFLMVITIWMAFVGYPSWIHKVNFGTYSGLVSYKITMPIEGFDQSGNYISNQDFANKIVLIDFWHSGCGICFKEFPKFQALFDKYKNDSSIVFLAINKPQKRDTIGQAFSMIKERNYTFTTMIPVNVKLPDLFGVEYYPSVIILDKAGTVIFRGSIDNAENVVQGLIKNGMYQTRSTKPWPL